jgi:hypothetical protein
MFWGCFDELDTAVVVSGYSISVAMSRVYVK